MTALLSIAAPVAIMIACGVLGGFFEGRADAKQATANKPVDHAFSAWSRVITAAFVAFQFVLWSHFDWWTIAPLTVIGLSAFNPVFRMTMNKKRNLDWRYVAPWSNKYDRIWFSIMARIDLGVWPQNALWSHIEKDYRNGFSLWGKPPLWGTRKRVHRAGAIAYIAEAITLILCVILFSEGVRQAIHP